MLGVSGRHAKASLGAWVMHAGLDEIRGWNSFWSAPESQRFHFLVGNDGGRSHPGLWDRHVLFFPGEISSLF